ncbi:hypothetical protein BGZ51_004460 [Haplosporangium sp. Z 767]|nr:hypothetical protein BGZ51_004460 [Haplosporangium sp. Z 767]KAF9195617.1 hypothetical protein BGZ50_004015 [Haplosporangium sp. Z 11]
MQLEIARIEQETGTPIKFRFPSMEKLSWFAVAAYESMGQEKLETLSNIELHGLVELTNYLFLRQQDVRIRKKLDPVEKKVIKQSVPPIAYKFRIGGQSGLSRRLNRMACAILTERGEVVNEAHRLLSPEDFGSDFAPVSISTSSFVSTPSVTMSDRSSSASSTTTAIVTTLQVDHENTLQEATTKELSPNTKCTLVNNNETIEEQILLTQSKESKDVKITLAEASANAPISRGRLLKRAAEDQVCSDQGSTSALCSASPRRKLR